MRFFNPWVGSAYWTSGIHGLRLLVLGESQYVSPETSDAEFNERPTPECSSSTQAIVRELALDRRNPFFTKITKLVLGVPAGTWVSDEQRVSFWQNVAFYNYVQCWIRAARRRPTESMWLEAQRPLLQTIEELKPHVLLVLGNELAQRLPAELSGLELVKVPHPSSRGFSYDPWSATVANAFSSAIRTINRGVSIKAR